MILGIGTYDQFPRPEPPPIHLHDDSSTFYTIFQSLIPNYTITEPGRGAVYYIQTIGPTHLTMYAGKDATGPVVGFAQYTTTVARLVRGDPVNAHSAIWEEMRRIDSFSGVRYRWEMAVLGEGGNVLRKAFLWKRTRSIWVRGLPAEGNQNLRRNYKLVDEETGELLAVFSVDLGVGCRTRLGKFQVLSRKYGEMFRMMVFLSAVSMRGWEDS